MILENILMGILFLVILVTMCASASASERERENVAYSMLLIMLSSFFIQWRGGVVVSVFVGFLENLLLLMVYYFF